MKLYVRDFDEMAAYDKRETWGWLGDRGRCSYERERMRTDKQQSLSVLCVNGPGEPIDVPPRNDTWADPAVPGEEPKGQGKKGPGGEAEDGEVKLLDGKGEGSSIP